MVDPIALVLAPLLGVAVLFALAVLVALRVRERRRAGWRELAARRGLRHDVGDPLGLGTDLGSRVETTLAGTAGGLDVLVLAEVRPGGDGPDPVTPVALARVDGVDVSGVVPDRRLLRLRTARHGDVLVLRPGARLRGAGSTARAEEAERLLDELLARLGRRP